MVYVVEEPGISRDVLRQACIDNGYPPGDVVTYNMRVYDVPQAVYDALPAPSMGLPVPPRSEPKTEEAPRRRGRPRKATEPVISKEADDGD
jgi:hypothetical protein